MLGRTPKSKIGANGAKWFGFLKNGQGLRNKDLAHPQSNFPGVANPFYVP